MLVGVTGDGGLTVICDWIVNIEDFFNSNFCRHLFLSFLSSKEGRRDIRTGKVVVWDIMLKLLNSQAGASIVFCYCCYGMIKVAHAPKGFIAVSLQLGIYGIWEPRAYVSYYYLFRPRVVQYHCHCWEWTRVGWWGDVKQYIFDNF